MARSLLNSTFYDQHCLNDDDDKCERRYSERRPRPFFPRTRNFSPNWAGTGACGGWVGPPQASFETRMQTEGQKRVNQPRHSPSTSGTMKRKSQLFCLHANPENGKFNSWPWQTMSGLGLILIGFLCFREGRMWNEIRTMVTVLHMCLVSSLLLPSNRKGKGGDGMGDMWWGLRKSEPTRV